MEGFVVMHLYEPSRGIQRVVDAVEADADTAALPYELIHVNGRVDTVRRLAERCVEAARPYIVCQYVLRSTLNPHTRDWLPIWERAALVWSYYDLPTLCARDGTKGTFPFYFAPLGISPSVSPAVLAEEKVYAIVTHGEYLEQSTRECAIAADPEPVAHLGRPFSPPQDHVVHFEDIDDERVADLYALSRYVNGLRRHEGFELPAAEGLACGARPLLFDRDCYRHWYGDHAVYIEEGTREWVIAQIREVLASNRPVSGAERAWARTRFDWAAILSGLRDQL